MNRVQAFLRGVQVRVLEKPKRPESNELSQRSLKVLVKAALEPMLTLVLIYAALGLHPAEGKAAVDDLLARGYVQLHRLARKGRGGQPTVVEVLSDGVSELAKRGITPAGKRIGRGGFKHDLYGRHVERWARAQGYARCWFERTLGGKAFDVLYEDEDGKLHGVEICLSGSAELNAKQLLKAAAVAGLEDVVAGCERQAFLNSVLRELKRIDGLGLYRGRITGKVLAEYITE